jgi:hypothetical protein
MKKRLLMLVVGFVLFSGFTVSWDPVTTYTDNTLIESTKTVLYNVDRGGVIVSAKQAGTSFVFTTGKGIGETFKLQAELNTGEKSVFSPPYSWTSPLGVPTLPSNLRVAP